MLGKQSILVRLVQRINVLYKNGLISTRDRNDYVYFLHQPDGFELIEKKLNQELAKQQDSIDKRLFENTLNELKGATG
jgi:hypothetical protein